MSARFALVPERSTVVIEARSSLHPIRVEAPATGWIEPPADVSVAGPTAGLIEIPVADLRSGNPLIDRETRRRIDASRHPTITGELTEIGVLKEGHATIEGIVEFMGERVALEGEIELRIEASQIAMTGAATFDVRWWGLEPPRLLVLKVDPEVVVTIDLVFER